MSKVSRVPLLKHNSDKGKISAHLSKSNSKNFGMGWPGSLSGQVAGDVFI